MEKLYAFWKYGSSTCPFLGGTVTKFFDDGCVYIKSYQGKFKPVLIVPYAIGIKIHDRLKQLEVDAEKVIDQTRKEVLKTANSLLGLNV